MSKTIQLTRGMVAIVDDADYDFLNQWKWCSFKAGGKWYAFRGPGILMHRLITGAPKEKDVDHRNGNGLDNRRKNLRVCSESQNAFNKNKYKNNTSGFKGVERRVNRWQATIRANNKRYYIGSFPTAEDAALAYDRAARELHGSFARLNFPEGAR
jgi:hypothetical protein